MRFQNEQYLGRLTGRYLRHCIYVLLVFLAFGLHTVYAFSYLEGRGSWRRTTTKPFVWENPVTGDEVSLLSGRDASVQYRFYINVPGLHWTVRRSTNTGSGGPDSRNYFDFFIMRTPDFNEAQTKESEDYILKPDGGEKTVCNRLMLQGAAIGKNGKSYDFIKLKSVFGRDRKNYSVLFLNKGAALHTPWDEDALCPIVKSFHDKEDNIQRKLSGDNNFWINTLSSNPVQLSADVKIEIEDIISHRLGSYQKYLMTFELLRAEFIKVRGKPYGEEIFDTSDIQSLHMTDGTVLQWLHRDGKIVERVVQPSVFSAYKKYEGQFSQAMAEGQKRTGVVFGGLRSDGFVLVKVWRSDEKALDFDERRWAELMFNNSLESVPVWN